VVTPALRSLIPPTARDTLPYRIGTYATFLRAMLDRLPLQTVPDSGTGCLLPLGRWRD
jgi:hypothetical protein